MRGLPPSDIADLSRRITALRERIVVMVHEGQQTRDQSELLVNLLGTLRAAKAARALDLERLSMQKTILPVTTAWRIR
jgi:hypothetical protein